MIDGQRVVVVLPAYEAAQTLPGVVAAVRAQAAVDEVICVDDASPDATATVAQRLGLRTLRHAWNRGYGANQKTCYQAALASGADVVVMLHPDAQYDPRLVTPLAAMVASGTYDAVLASRITAQPNALAGGMPRYKYVANRLLTAFENVLLGLKLSEYHTGYRAYSRAVLAALPLDRLSDDFVFDNQILAQVRWAGFRIGEISCPTHYGPESHSISVRRAWRYGWGVVATALTYRAARWGWPVWWLGRSAEERRRLPDAPPRRPPAGVERPKAWTAGPTEAVSQRDPDVPAP